MGLEEAKKRGRKYYLTISEGQISHSEDGKREYFASVSGTLEKIYKQERNFNSETVQYWYIDIRGEKDELYSISLPYKSGVFKSIILALASEPAIALSPIKIEPYKKGDFTKVVVSSGDKRLDWVTKELPAVEEFRVSGQIFKDDTKRMAYINTLVQEINTRL